MIMFKKLVFVLFTIIFGLLLICENRVNGKVSAHSGITTPIVVPVERLKEARQYLGSTQNFTLSFPSWVNTTLLQIGQNFLAKNYVGYLYAMGLSSLLVGSSTDARRVVISAGNTTESNKAMHRYLINILHFSYWATNDLSKDKESFFESLNIIHAVHAKVGLAAHQKQNIYKQPLIKEPLFGQNPFKIDIEMWNALERDLRASRLKKYKEKPIFPPRNGGTDFYLNQFAMAMQQWAFVAYPVIEPEKVLIYNATDEERWGYIHFWALIGHAVGIQEQFNVCLQPDLKTAEVYFRQILRKYFIPSLLNLDYESKVVMEVGVKGIQGIFEFVDFGLALKRLCVDILQIECPQVQKTMKAQSLMWDSVFKEIGKGILRHQFPNSAVRFVINGIIQGRALNRFKFNTLLEESFGHGLLALDEEILRTSDVYYDGNNITHTNDIFY